METVKLTRADRALATRVANRLFALDRREFKSNSDPDRTYVAMIMADGRLSCDCRGWITKKVGRPRRCRHTDVLAAGRPTTTDGDYLYVKVAD